LCSLNCALILDAVILLVIMLNI